MFPGTFHDNIPCHCGQPATVSIDITTDRPSGLIFFVCAAHADARIADLADFPGAKKTVVDRSFPTVPAPKEGDTVILKGELCDVCGENQATALFGSQQAYDLTQAEDEEERQLLEKLSKEKRVHTSCASCSDKSPGELIAKDLTAVDIEEFKRRRN